MSSDDNRYSGMTRAVGPELMGKVLTSKVQYPMPLTALPSPVFFLRISAPLLLFIFAHPCVVQLRVCIGLEDTCMRGIV